MTISQTPISVAERRLAIAHRLYEALVGQDPDSSGSVVARHDPGLNRVLQRLRNKAAHEQLRGRAQACPLCFSHPASNGTEPKSPDNTTQSIVWFVT
jgi:hypothetical protein